MGDLGQGAREARALARRASIHIRKARLGEEDREAIPIVGTEALSLTRLIAVFNTLDDDCDGTLGNEYGDGVRATSGTLTVETVTDDEVTGTYDLTFPSVSAKGAFNIPSCTKSLDEIHGTKTTCAP